MTTGIGWATLTPAPGLGVFDVLGVLAALGAVLGAALIVRPRAAIRGLDHLITAAANRTRTGPGRPRDRGSASLLVVIVAPGLLLVAGLVYDGSSKIRAARTATSAAAEAARAATQAIAPDAITGAPARIDTAAAARAARAYLHNAGITGSVQVAGNTVTIDTTVDWQPVFLSAVGAGTQTVTGHAAARTQRR